MLFGHGNAYYVGDYDSEAFEFTPLGMTPPGQPVAADGGSSYATSAPGEPFNKKSYEHWMQTAGGTELPAGAGAGAGVVAGRRQLQQLQSSRVVEARPVGAWPLRNASGASTVGPAAILTDATPAGDFGTLFGPRTQLMVPYLLRPMLRPLLASNETLEENGATTQFESQNL
jgi:hypothetical protein